MGRTVPSYRIATEMEKTTGKHLGKGWTRRTKKSLMKCSLIHDSVTLRVITLADLY
jgi:hypothetical protein